MMVRKKLLLAKKLSSVETVTETVSDNFVLHHTAHSRRAYAAETAETAKNMRELLVCEHLMKGEL